MAANTSSNTKKSEVAEQNAGEQDTQINDQAQPTPEHDPAHGRWILDPVTGEKRNNNED